MMSRNRAVQVALPIAGVFLVILSKLIPMLMHWHVLRNFVYMMPEAAADFKYGIIPLNPSLLPAHFAQHLVTTFPDLLWYGHVGLGLSYSGVTLVLTIIQNLLLGGAGYFLGRKITGTPWGGLFAVATIYMGWVCKTCISYSLTTNVPAFEGSLTISMGFAVLALWFWDRRWLASFLVGLLISIHVVNGLVMATVLFVDSLIRLKEKKANIIPELCRWSVVAILVAPTAWHIIQELKQNSSLPVDWAAYWTLMDVRKIFHVRPWLILGSSMPTFCMASLYASGLYWSQRTRRIQSEVAKKAWILLFSVLALLLVNMLGVELFKNVGLATTQFSKGTMFLIPLVGPLVYLAIAKHPISLALLFLLLLDIGTSSYLMYGATLVFLFAFWLQSRLTFPDHQASKPAFCLTIFEGAWFIYFLALLYAVPKTPKLYLVCASAFWLIFLTLLLSRAKVVHVYNTNLFDLVPKKLSKYLISVLMIVFAVLYGRMVRHELSISLSTEPRLVATEQLGSWVREHTPKNSVLVIPHDLDCAPYCLGRQIVYNSVWMGISQYLHQGLEIEKKALLTIFDFDLTHPDQISSFRTTLDAELMKRYSNLDRAHTERILKAYPEVGYLVAERLSSQGEYKPDGLNLPVLYENSMFRIYSLQK